jgi:hypothetical protein
MRHPGGDVSCCARTRDGGGVGARPRRGRHPTSSGAVGLGLAPRRAGERGGDGGRRVSRLRGGAAPDEARRARVRDDAGRTVARGAPRRSPSGGRCARAGEGAAARIIAGEPWRTVTALCLHVNLPHLVGNAAAIALFDTLLGRMLGPCLTAALVLVASAGGNWLNAVLRAGAHTAVGASTGIFGAIGILAGLEFVRRRRGVRGQAWLAIGGSLALLGVLGTAARADLGAGRPPPRPRVRRGSRRNRARPTRQVSRRREDFPTATGCRRSARSDRSA